MDERLYWLGFSTFSGIGPVKFKILLNTFGSAHDAWNAQTKSLKTAIGEKTTEQFEVFRDHFSIEEYNKKLHAKQVAFITLQDSDYPDLLKQTSKPPFVLYVKGNMTLLSSRALRQVFDSEVAQTRGAQGKLGRGDFSSEIASPTEQDRNDRIVAIVGTRKITSYGREVTQLFANELVRAGFTIVSGLALGVDAVAHATTIGSNGKTIAVLGCGVDCCYPRENQNLYNRIIESGGVVVSEIPLSQSPTKGTFPSRNRIIAGMSQAVLVTEGAEDSGSIITAEIALKEGRKVFAVPGPITSSLSKGPFKLIAKGAKLVTGAEEIITELGVQKESIKGIKSTKSIKGDSKEETKILQLLANEALHFDEIVRRAKIDSSKIGSLLSVMELKGFIKSLDGGEFKIA